MIKKLILENFGRFKDKTFELNPVTLFFGHNESGKTTIFDALFHSICNPKGNTKGNNKLNARYNDKRLAKIECDGEQISMEESDFLNIYAIRSGEINTERDKSDEEKWKTGAKALLYSDKIDPESIAEDLNGKITGKGKGTWNKEYLTIKEELKKCEIEYNNAQEKRRQFLEEEKHIVNSRNNVDSINNEISKLKKEIEKIDKKLNIQRDLQNIKKSEAVLLDLAELRKLEKEKEAYSGYSDEDLNIIKNKEIEIQKLESEVYTAIELEKNIQNDLNAILEEKKTCEKRKIDEDALSSLSKQLYNNLVPRDKFAKTGKNGALKLLFLIIAGILLLSGGFIVLVMPQNWILSVIAFAAFIFFVIMAKVKKESDNSSLLDAEIRKTADIWKNETGEELQFNYEKIITVLSNASARAEITKENLRKLIDRSAELERKINDIKANKINKENSLRKIKNEISAVNGIDYSKKLADKNNIIKRYDELSAKIKNARNEYRVNADNELEIKLNGILSELNNKITDNDTEIPPKEIQSLVNIREITNNKLSKLTEEHAEELKKVSHNQGFVEGQYKELIKIIAEKEKRINELEIKCKDTERKKRAAEIARDLFLVMAKKTDFMFNELSNEISDQFSEIISDKRKINMNNVMTKDAKVTDVIGINQDMDNLSTGTRDAFLLAARLNFAGKSKKEAVIILDEPFLTLDKPRTARALLVLKKFRSTVPWQIIIFTKDEETAYQAGEVFGEELKVYKL